MTRDERRKAISTAVAAAAQNRLVPEAVRVGIAAMAEELRDQGERLDRIESHPFDLGGSDGKK